jgi:hypothetical protein
MVQQLQMTNIINEETLLIPVVFLVMVKVIVMVSKKDTKGMLITLGENYSDLDSQEV